MFPGAGLLAVGLISLFSASVEAQKCTGQSCDIAALATSRNEPYKQQGNKKPSGGNAAGEKCIRNSYTTLGVPTPQGMRYVDLSALQMRKRFRRDLGIQSKAETEENIEEFYSELAKTWPQEADEVEPTLDKRQGGCKANTLMFGRGTTEPGVMGSTVGPALQRELTKSGWAVEGITYSADIAGIYCLGMPGGIKCIDQINKLAQRCPNTKIVLSGYSQGAMVARICAAWAGEAAKKQIKGLALFGDPFNGADVKGIPDSKVRTWCASGDGVCKGQFSITAAHMSYVGASTNAAVQWIQGLVKN